MNYREALAWLYGTQLFGIKLGLENIQHLLGALAVPAPDQRIIHVAGTNGKGSVCAMIDAIVRAAGFRTGLFTSPHLITFRERIRAHGEMIGPDDVAAGLTSIRDLVADWDPHPTFFEITTALALQHFKRAACEVIVLETGMGGRLDATNAVTPVVSVITPIDYDHQKWLGNSLGEIASEKAGIIKTGVPVVAALQAPDAEAVITQTANERNAPLRFVTRPDTPGPIALPGDHQRENAALAIAALAAAQIATSPQAINAGLTSVTWPARFQQWNERITIDGAHNPAGARVLAKTWRDLYGEERAAIILAVLRDKDVAGMVRALAPIASHFLLPPARTERALPPDELAAIIRGVTPAIEVKPMPSLSEALEQTRERRLITGSLHFAGEALALLQGTPEELEDCAQ